MARRHIVESTLDAVLCSFSFSQQCVPVDAAICLSKVMVPKDCFLRSPVSDRAHHFCLP